MAPVRDRVLIMRMMSAGVGGLMSDFVPRGRCTLAAGLRPTRSRRSAQLRAAAGGSCTHPMEASLMPLTRSVGWSCWTSTAALTARRLGRPEWASGGRVVSAPVWTRSADGSCGGGSLGA